MNTPRPRRPARIGRSIFALTAATTLLIGCSSDASDSSETVATETSVESISIELARTPIPTAGQTETPVYGILVNDSLDEMRVISATSPLADSVDLLGPDDSIVLPAEGFNVLPDGGLVMEPVGFKLMLNGIDPEAIDEAIPVTLRFQSGGTFEFSANVQELDT